MTAQVSPVIFLPIRLVMKLLASPIIESANKYSNRIHTIYSLHQHRLCVLMALIVMSFLINTSTSSAQNSGVAPASSPTFKVSDWKTYTSMLTVRATAMDGNGVIWAATSGGAFSYNPTTGSYEEYRNQNALSRLDLTAVGYDRRNNNMYFGTFDGVIEILNLTTKTWTAITDVLSSSEQYPKRTIYNFTFLDSIAFIATDFGFLVFNTDKQVVVETVDKVASFAPKSVIRVILPKGDSIIVAGSEGAAIASLNNLNRTRTFRLPSAWRVYTPFTTGLQYSDAITHPNNITYLLTAKNLVRIKGDSITNVERWEFELMGNFVRWNNEIYFNSTTALRKLIPDSTSVATQLKHPSDINSIDTFTISGKTALIVNYIADGIGIVRQPTDTLAQLIAPNTPLTNRFRKIAVDARGALWSSTSFGDREGQGFMCFNGTRWLNYSMAKTKFIKTDAYYAVSADCNGNAWLSSWGAGMLQGSVSGDSLTFSEYNSNNTPMIGLPNNSLYTIPGLSICDRSSNTWFSYYGNSLGGGPHIIVRKRDGTFKGFTYPGNPGNLRDFLGIAVDGAGTKWLASKNNSGLMFFNEGGTIDDERNDKWGLINSSSPNSQLAENQINCITADKTGVIWLGTPSSGVYAIFNPSLALGSTSPRVSQIRLLSSQVVNDIVVDATNNKWVATNSGIWILNEDGSEVLAQINKSNSPLLLSDEILTLASDESTGTIYIGSLQGLNSVKTLALAPVQSYSIQVFPQPFNPQRDGELTIDGLEPESQVRIVTVDGMLIRNVTTKSRRIVWDGRDENGVLVSSGIYLALAVSSENATSTVQKISVVR
jgi:hypothetical protein